MLIHIFKVLIQINNMIQKISLCIFLCSLHGLLFSEVSPVRLNKADSDSVYSFEYRVRKNHVIGEYQYKLRKGRLILKPVVTKNRNVKIPFENYINQWLPVYSRSAIYQEIHKRRIHFFESL